jgi:SpoVK/Ycf46/Vps4 family AAA+-type ATPase
MILYSRGVTKSPEVIEVSRADIVGQYTGWSAKLTAKAFDRAKDAILFIDEAYSLVEDHNSFGQEVINQLVREMDNRHDVIVILAGYPDKMEEFLCKNPGLRSRIRWTVNFPDYTEEELFLIAQHIASRYGYKLADDVKGKIMPMIAEAKKSHEFGNGRWCRKLVENSELRWSARVKRMDDNEITTDVLDTLIAGDFVRPSDLKTEHRTIGFVVS